MLPSVPKYTAPEATAIGVAATTWIDPVNRQAIPREP